MIREAHILQRPTELIAVTKRHYWHLNHRVRTTVRLLPAQASMANLKATMVTTRSGPWRQVHRNFRTGRTGRKGEMARAKLSRFLQQVAVKESDVPRLNQVSYCWAPGRDRIRHVRLLKTLQQESFVSDTIRTARSASKYQTAQGRSRIRHPHRQQTKGEALSGPSWRRLSSDVTWQTTRRTRAAKSTGRSRPPQRFAAQQATFGQRLRASDAGT